MPFKEVSFNDTEKAFSAKDDKALKKSSWLFKFMGKPLLVKIFSKLTLFSFKIGLPIKGMVKSTIFSQFCGGESLDESQEAIKKLKHSRVGSILDYSVEGKETEEDFEKTKNEILKIIGLAKGNPAIPYTCLKLTGIMTHSILEKINAPRGVLGTRQTLSLEEQKQYDASIRRLNEIFQQASDNKIPVYIDAEESWIQEAIDGIAEAMMKKYNRESAVVLTTLQMYRWDRMDYLNRLIENARKEKYFIGIKLVRGAYLERENERAKTMGYKSPMQTSKENTDIDFDKAVTVCLENVDLITLCAGTHNEASTMFLIGKMTELKIDKDNPHVYFSQLYGMSDHITFNLADAGYNVTKYLPYGPIKSVIPYLIRRAQENTGIAGQMGRELKLIMEEKNRRQHNLLLKSGS